PIPPAPVAHAGQQVAPEILAAHAAWVKGSKEIAGLMLMTMEPEIQRNLEPLHAHEMLKELKTLFAQQAEQELLQTTRDFHSCKQEEGQSVSSYVLKMKGYIDNLECLGHPVTLGLGVSLILIGLRKECDGFVQNYNMHSMGKTVNELHAMLKLHEQTLPKSNAPALNAIRAVSSRVNEEEEEHNFGSWWFRASKKLKPGALSLYVGNGQREAVEAIGAFYLCLPSGLEIVLNNCHYASSITRGVISVSRLDGIFEIDLSNSLTNESSVYAVSNKRAKLDLDSALLWHCRLGHISKKRIEKLQHDRLLNSSDLTDYALETAARIPNMVPTKKVEKTPYEVWHRKAPKLFYLKVWGCEALVKRDTLTKPNKLELRSNNCIFVGYPKETMGYSFYYPPENKVLVELPPNGKTVCSKWLFKKKTDMDGNVHIYKASLVAKGFTQTPRIDYEETFSPVADIRAIRILIAIAAYYDYEIWQMDRYCMENSKRESIPMQEKLKLSKLQGTSTPAEIKRMQNVPYASAVGSIMYAVRCTRPDVAFAKNITS
nr:zinc finger, CCHC-type [Tanacetum cinerariifolium]